MASASCSDRSPIETALDVFVYAPVGFALEARELLPRLAERGRGQVALTRLFARLAWQRGQAEADRILARAAGAPATPPTAPAPCAVAPEPPAATVGPAAVPPTRATRAAAPTRTRRPARPVAASPALVVSDLAIPSYDTLAASQVVPRLAALRPDELEQVRVYEAANRGRRTILTRIAQLQG